MHTKYALMRVQEESYNICISQTRHKDEMEFDPEGFG
jgi:hypothetical protein